MVTIRFPHESQEWGMLLVGLSIAYIVFFLVQGETLYGALVVGTFGGAVLTAIVAVLVFLRRGIQAS